MKLTELDKARFWSKVKVGGLNDCWPWIAGERGRGYGNFWLNGKTENSHKVAYEIVVGSVPDGLELDHLCRSRICVNPRHLEAVTRRTNNLRGESPRLASERAKKRHAARTHCKRGHEFTFENTATYLNNGFMCRTCKQCRREQKQIWRKKVGWHTKNYKPLGQQ